MAITTARVTTGTHNPSISAQTVRNRLREAGQRACRPVVRQVLTRHHRQQRHLWAQAHCRWTRQDWQKVLFTDELQFCLSRGDGRIHIYCRRNERNTEACTLERDRLGGGGSVMVWAVYHSIIGLSLLSLQAISKLCVTGKTSSYLMWYPSCQLILT
uniref:Transposase Tc1-like domain-containing protein n=1 Tax=Oncorhynchus tshawytscha TaxID=74940 RepID=A0AAZ3SBX0_ONCTS